MKTVPITGVLVAVMTFGVMVTMHEASRADRLVSQAVPSVAEKTLKSMPPQTPHCDCSNCSAEHCLTPAHGPRLKLQLQPRG